MSDEESPPRRQPRWWLHLSRLGKWLVATVAASVIGVVVSLALDGGDDDGPVTQTPTATSTPNASPVPVPPERLVSSQVIGRYGVEDDGTAEGATEAFGQPTERTPARTQCTMRWGPLGVTIQFIHLGAGDPCLLGEFCSASISGRDWRTSTGLAAGDPVRRLWDLYPRAREIRDGAITRYVLERATAPCGQAEGGLEAWAGSGRVSQLHVSFRAAGD